MKRQALLASAVCSILFYTNVSVAHDYAPFLQTELTTISEDSLDRLSNEELEAYYDSIYRAGHPKLDTIHEELSNTPAIRRVKRQTSFSYSNSYVPSSVSVNTASAVGQIDIEPGVSPTGGKTYTVPIKAYRHDGVFSPDISLSYNSQSGPSYAGKGWTIGGLQFITRGNKNYYFDGKPSGIKMKPDDAFYLNGLRLVKTSSTAYEYETEQGNIKVTATVSGDITCGFYVYYPNGYKATFGYPTSGVSNFVEYPMRSLTDERGRTISYDYEYSGHYLIKTISYDNNTAKIQFTYSSGLSNYSSGYCGGGSISDNRLLTTITCSRDNAVMGTYSLTYTTSSIPALLKEISYSVNGSSLNPLKFYYGDGSASDAFNISTVTYKDAYQYDHRNQVAVVRGRFDYVSGCDALFVYPAETPYFMVSSGSSRKYLQNKYDENQSIYSYLHFGEDASNDLPSFKIGKNFVDLFMADLEGNQSECLVKVSEVVVGDVDRLTFAVSKYNPSTKGIIRYKTHVFDLQTVYTDGKGNKSYIPKAYYAGDFNGDGKMEVLAVSADNPFGESNHPSMCYIFDLIDGKKLYEQPLFHFHKEFPISADMTIPDSKSDKLIPMDYDGDGKMEICHLHENGSNIYSFNSTDGVWRGECAGTSSAPSRFGFYMSFYSCGDFNGDGLPDIIASPQLGNTSDWWSIYYSKGNGTFGFKNFHGPKVKDNPSFIVQDLNGDGVTDLIELTETQMKTYAVWDNNPTLVGSTVTLSSKNELVVPVRFNASSLTSQLLSIKGNKASLYSYLTNRQTDQALTGMVNSNGVIDKNYYYSIGKNLFGIYTLGTYSASFPYSNIHEEIPVLAGNEVFLKGSSKDINKFYYSNGVLHRQGLGFRGFETVRVQNKRGQNTTTLYEPYNFCQVKEIDGPTSKTTLTNSVTVAGNKIRKTKISSKKEYDKLKDVTATTAYTYDSYGQVLTANTTLPGSITVNKTYTYNNYTNISSKYHLGVLATLSITTKRGSSQHVEATSYTYNASDQPLTVINKVNGKTVRTTTNVYDSNGNMTSQSVKPYSATTARTSTFTYTTGNRMTKATDPVGIYKSFTYNTDGTVSKITTSTGSTEYTYDAFRRVTKEKQPDGTIVNTRYAWNSSMDGLYAVTRSGTGIPTTTTVYDAMNREVGTQETRFDGSTLMVSKTYDAYGNLSTESLPYKKTISGAKNYTYDSYNRLTKRLEAGKTISYSYSGLSTTVNDGTISTTTTTDALGGVVSVKDPSGTITYTLNGVGNPTKIVTPASSGTVTTTIAYDNFERRSSVADPSHGTTTYTYDTDGRLKQEKNANGKTISYTYDNYDRLTKKTMPEFSTTYTYDNKLNMLTAATSSNGPSTTYTYDTYGRLSSSKETAVDSKWLQKNYSYANGRVSAIKYTSQSGVLTTENYTYANGHLTEVKLDGTTSIFKLTAENSMGQPINVTTGSLARNYGYTTLGYPSSRSVTGNSKTYQSWTYSFTPTTGNLANRYNAQNSKTEAFTYDNQHRLISFGGTNVEYDANGNITKKGDVGNFTYGISGKPFAVSEVMLTNNISVGTQSVSYTSFDRPSSITDNGYTVNFTYNGDYDRVKMALQKNSSSTLTRYYLGGCYELDIKPSGTTEKLYLNGGYYDAPAVLTKKGSSKNVYYILRDHLGSITHVINASGTVMQELSYDAWGRLRNPSTYAAYTPANEPEPYLGRGYCGHEHLTGLGLINMNARLYDPLLGRFLSSDPYISLPYSTQSYNRYSYGLNNPLINIDRDGENPIFAIGLGIAIGAYLGGVIANGKEKKNKWNPLKWDYSRWQTYVGIIAGGTLGGYVGHLIEVGELVTSFAAITPFGAVGLDFSKDKQGNPSTNLEVCTPMGGYYNSGEEKAAKNAEEAYNNAVSSFQRNYEVLTSNLSTNSSAMKYYGPMELAPSAAKLSKWSTASYYLGEIGFIGKNSVRAGYITPEAQKEIFKITGGAIGAWIGGRTAGIAMAGVFSETGPGAAVAGIYGYVWGSYMGQQIGENIGNSMFNLFYDFYFPMTNLKELMDYSNSLQNNYQPIW